MTQRRVVHLDVIDNVPTDEDHLLCGNQGLNIDVTLKKSEVTCKSCKRCLAKRKK